MDDVDGDVSALNWQDFDLVSVGSALSDFADEMITRNSEEKRDPADDEVGLMEFDVNGTIESLADTSLYHSI